MKKIIIVSILLLNIFVAKIYAQENIIKLHISELFLTNISLNYEREITDRTSFAINAGFFIPRKIPNMFISNPVVDDLEIKNILTGFSILPEFRFYLEKKDDLSGFYIAPFLRYRNYSIKFNNTYDNIETRVQGTYSTIGGGVQFGIQGTIKEVISIDWYILGIGVNYNSFSLMYNSDESGIDYLQLKKDIDIEIADMPIFNKRVKTEAAYDYIKGVATFILPSFRTGISIGYIF
ncbi:MAG: DUF3575 domain-containing protein, partial [Bacteroidota bacterium]|nr:DUF3575 domain-containing protein [Bacteroidota bacterium]